MKRNKWHFLLALSILVVTVLLWSDVSQNAVAAHDEKINAQDNQKILAKVSTLRIPFLSNEGQVAKEVEFYAKTFGGTVYVTQKGEIVYALTKKEKDQTIGKRYKHQKDHKIRVCVLKERLLQTKDVRLQAQEKAVTKVNYFIGGKDNWKTNIPSFNRVSFGQVYDHIELALRAYANNIEKIFTVHPEGKVEDIRLVMEGAQSMTVNSSGELEIDTEFGAIKFTPPVAFQEIDGKREKIQVAYAVKGHTYGFQVSEYDQQLPLIIDPTLAYSTYLGGSGAERFGNIVVDSSGNVYVIGYSASTDFPTQNAFQASYAGNTDVFVTKLASTGDTLSYSTYLGGSGLDTGYAIAIDDSENAYVAGFTQSDDFPTLNPYQATHSDTAYRDAFVAKLDSTGSSLVYSTYIGGVAGDDEGYGIAVDSAGNAYVTGYTAGGFPTQTPYQVSFGGGSNDAFVTKFTTTGDALSYSTFLGGDGDDMGRSIAVDSSGNAYVTGYTQSSNFPTQNAFQSSHSDTAYKDAFVTKLSSTGAALSFSTYLGGSGGDDDAFRIALDSSDSSYAVGTTESSSFPTQNPYQASYAGGSDAFVTKLSSDGASLSYSTYLGGAASESGSGIAVDSSGNAFVSGTTLSSNFPTQNPYQPSLSGGSDTFLTKFSSTGNTISYSTYLGGTDLDPSYGIAVDSSGNAYVSGFTQSSDFPTLNAFQSSYAGAVDCFVAKFEFPSVSDTTPSTPTAISPADDTKYTTADPITLSASAFSDPDTDDSHSKSHWKVKYAGSVYDRADYDASFNFEDSSGNLTTHTVSGLAEGMKYIWKVRYEDSTGNLSPWSAEYSFKIGTSVSESLPLVYSGKTTADFDMMSFVHWPDVEASTGVFGITYDTKYYRIGWYNTSAGGYTELTDSLKIVPGRAYWVLARQGLQVTYNGIPVSLTTGLDVGLAYIASTGNGWNMIACPNAANYLWADVEVVEYDANGNIVFGPTAISALPDPNAFIDKRLWRWDSGSYYSNTTLMEKYNGYWVKAKKANVYLRFPISAQASLSNPKIMFASHVNKGKRWLNKWILAPTEAIAHSGDTPPPPMVALRSDTNQISASCFIATAAYGSSMAPHVKVLREFRDRFLLANRVGKSLVDFYYKTSPPLADFIKKHAHLRTIIRLGLLPVVGVSWLMLEFGPLATMAILTLLCSGFVGLLRARLKKP
jgi:hypothetical protein